MHDVVITTAIRTPVGRAHKGLLKDTRPDDLGAHVIREALARTPGVAPEHVDDVLLGNAHPEGEAGYNMARIAGQIAGLPDSVAGATINRFCASGLQTMVQGIHSVANGMADVVLAGGSDCTSRVPMGGATLAEFLASGETPAASGLTAASGKYRPTLSTLGIITPTHPCAPQTPGASAKRQTGLVR